MKAVSFGDSGKERPGVVEDNVVVDFLALRPDWPTDWRGLLSGDWLPTAYGAAPAAKRGEASVAKSETVFDVESDTDSDPVSGATFDQVLDAISDAVCEARRRGLEVPLEEVRLGPPIPNPSKIVAVGLNFRDHAEEQGAELPQAPLLFAKAPSCLVGPTDPIVLPDPEVEARVDAEAELCVVIGKRATNVSETSALDAVFGFTAFNDVSGRRAQGRDGQWFRGKSFDTFGPSGPWVVTKDELGDPGNLTLECDWDDEPMQRGHTSNLIFSVPELVAYISRQMTLLPGDLIATGTPAGVGVFRKPRVFLESGMTVEVRLEKVGTLRNPVR